MGKIPPIKKKQRREIMRAMALITQIGFMVAACILAGVFLGRWLDGLLGTTPWLLLVFSLLGVGAAFKSMIDLANR